MAREVAAALTEYRRLFSSKRADEMAERGYGAPLMSLGLDNYAVWATRQDVEAWAGSFVWGLTSPRLGPVGNAVAEHMSTHADFWDRERRVRPISPGRKRPEPARHRMRLQ